MDALPFRISSDAKLWGAPSKVLQLQLQVKIVGLNRIMVSYRAPNVGVLTHTTGERVRWRVVLDHLVAT
jgi:hypothetical protein